MSEMSVHPSRTQGVYDMYWAIEPVVILGGARIQLGFEDFCSGI